MDCWEDAAGLAVSVATDALSLFQVSSLFSGASPDEKLDSWIYSYLSLTDKFPSQNEVKSWDLDDWVKWADQNGFKRTGVFYQKKHGRMCKHAFFPIYLYEEKGHGQLARIKSEVFHYFDIAKTIILNMEKTKGNAKLFSDARKSHHSLEEMRKKILANHDIADDAKEELLGIIVSVANECKMEVISFLKLALGDNSGESAYFVFNEKSCKFKKEGFLEMCEKIFKCLNKFSEYCKGKNAMNFIESESKKIASLGVKCGGLSIFQSYETKHKDTDMATPQPTKQTAPKSHMADWFADVCVKYPPPAEPPEKAKEREEMLNNALEENGKLLAALKLIKGHISHDGFMELAQGVGASRKIIAEFVKDQP